ncbi:MAG: Gfo/Idh/MocA family oxidoreductase [Paludibacteraceae bacterium]|nr:Gfo/Idh/MocA family oxidoreductase [Paludibacteraceae bacterium]
MDRVIRFAVVGQGHIGKRHAEMIRRNPCSVLSAVCDVRDKSATGCDDIQEPYYRSLEDMLAACPDVDVVNICVPNGLHAPLAIQALRAGHHVVIEKPVTLSRSSAEQIRQVSEQVNRCVFCVMQNRYSPPSVWLKDVMDKRLLGDVYMVQLNCFWNRDSRYYMPRGWHGTADLDGGTLYTQFSHFVDIMYWLLGDITNIKARFADFNHQTLTDFEDSGFVTFDFVNGGMGTFNYSTSVYDSNLESSITIIGEHGTVRVAGQYMDKVAYCNIQNYQMPELAPSNPPNDYGMYKGSAQNHGYVIQNVIDTLNGHARPTTTLHDGTMVVDIIERIYRQKQFSKG